MNSEAMSSFLSGEWALGKPPRAIAGTPPLRALTQAIRRGDEQAFTSFYQTYSLRLYQYLLVLAKGNETEAREVLQTVILKLAAKIPVLDGEQQLWAWLARVSRNAFTDYCRSRQRNAGNVPIDDIDFELTEPEVAEHRLAESLALALKHLTADESELLRAAYVDERPLQELADEQKQTYKALESRLGRLRKKLKDAWLRSLHDEKQS